MRHTGKFWEAGVEVALKKMIIPVGEVNNIRTGDKSAILEDARCSIQK
jgi:hypothetical protein